MKLDIKKYVYQFVILVIALLAIHFLLFRAIGDKLGVSQYQLIEIYGFLFFLNIFHFFILQWLFTKWPTYAGLLFTALSFLKMFVCILFLWPDIFPSNPGSIGLVLNFMTVYFATLTFEVVFIVKSQALGK